MRILRFALSILSLFGLSFVVSCTSSVKSDKKFTLEHAEQQRTYTVHLPPQFDKARATPLLMAFHGAGGQGDQFAQVGELEKYTDAAGYIVVYPNGLNKVWEVSSKKTPTTAPVDDLGFVDKVIKKVLADYTIDKKKIFALGISNGGQFTFRQACLSSNPYSAIAVVAMNIAKPYADDCKPGHPLSMIQIMGTKDPIVPYEGDSKNLLSAESTARVWRKLNSCPSNLESSVLDQDTKDETKIRIETASQCSQQSRVISYFVEGGGHTWPNGKQYYPERFIGKISKDMDAGKVIVQFFQESPELKAE